MLGRDASHGQQTDGEFRECKSTGWEDWQASRGAFERVGLGEDVHQEDTQGWQTSKEAFERMGLGEDVPERWQRGEVDDFAFTNEQESNRVSHLV